MLDMDALEEEGDDEQKNEELMQEHIEFEKARLARILEQNEATVEEGDDDMLNDFHPELEGLEKSESKATGMYRGGVKEPTFTGELW